jgi:hypothetical protein
VVEEKMTESFEKDKHSLQYLVWRHRDWQFRYIEECNGKPPQKPYFTKTLRKATGSQLRRHIYSQDKRYISGVAKA